MPGTVQEFFAAATPKAAEDLLEAYQGLPEDKRAWSPGGDSRTAIDQVAECALLTGYTAEVIQARAWHFPPTVLQDYPAAHSAIMALSPSELEARLLAAARQCAEAIKSIAESELTITIEMPWGPWTIERLIALSYWNMTYHLGQINYIARLPMNTTS